MLAHMAVAQIVLAETHSVLHLNFESTLEESRKVGARKAPDEGFRRAVLHGGTGKI